MSLKLYTSPGTCSLADHIALSWTAQPFEVVVVSREQRRSPEFLALNPAGAVPVLEHDGWVLTQNIAILNYIADTFPEAKLGGDGTPKGRAEANRWLALLNSDVHPTFRPLFGSMAHLGPEAETKAKEAARTKLREYFERIDAHLAGRSWLAGDARTIADPYLYVVMRWTRLVGVDLDGLSNLAGHFERMSADPGVQAALKAEGLS